VRKGQKKRIWTPEQTSEIVHKHLDEGRKHPSAAIYGWIAISAQQHTGSAAYDRTGVLFLIPHHNPSLQYRICGLPTMPRTALLRGFPVYTHHAFDSLPLARLISTLPPIPQTNLPWRHTSLSDHCRSSKFTRWICAPLKIKPPANSSPQFSSFTEYPALWFPADRPEFPDGPADAENI